MKRAPPWCGAPGDRVEPLVNKSSPGRSAWNPSAILLEHPTILLALAAAAFVVLRALVFTEFRVPAAITVLAKGGIEGVLVASAAALPVIVAPVIAVVAALGLRPGGVRVYWQRTMLWAALFGGVFFSLFVVPITIVIGIGGISAAGFLFFQREREFVTPSVLGSLLFSTILFVAFIPWLPAERITAGSQTFTGYVLEATSEWTTVLRTGGRIEILHSDDVTERVVCMVQVQSPLPNATLAAAIAGLFGVPPAQPLPVCPVE
jgi:hypothetical protein